MIGGGTGRTCNCCHGSVGGSLNLDIASNMTKREAFAKGILEGLYSHENVIHRYSYNDLASQSVQQADALIKELEKEVE